MAICAKVLKIVGVGVVVDGGEIYVEASGQNLERTRRRKGKS